MSRESSPGKDVYTYSLNPYSLKPATSFLAVAIERILDDRQRERGRLNLIDFHRFALQRLVILEETAEQGESMGR